MLNIFNNHTMNTISSFAVFIIGIYLLIVALMYLFQSKMVYFPSDDIVLTPDRYNMEFEEAWLRTADGMDIHGWYIPGESDAPVLLFCHGNAGNISNRLESINVFHQLGLNVFIFDYRGYGKSSGKPTETGTYHDVDAAWKYLEVERGFEPEKIIVFGRSLGSGPALYAAVTHKPSMLIIESGFMSVPDVAADVYPFLPVRMMSRIKYHNMDRIANIKCPVLIVHSPDDDLILYHHGEKLFQAASEPKHFLKITGGHNDGFLVSGSTYTEGLRDFIKLYSAK